MTAVTKYRQDSEVIALTPYHDLWLDGKQRALVVGILINIQFKKKIRIRS